MDPAAFAPSEELQEKLIYSISRCINVWLEHEEEFRRALEAQLQRLISNLPWLLDSFHPLPQDFLLNTLHLHPPAATASLRSPAEDVLPGPSEPSAGRKQRSRRWHVTPEPNFGTSVLPAVVSLKDTSVVSGTVYSGAVCCMTRDNSHSLPTSVITDLTQVGIFKTPKKATACISSAPSEHGDSEAVYSVFASPETIKPQSEGVKDNFSPAPPPLKLSLQSAV